MRDVVLDLLYRLKPIDRSAFVLTSPVDYGNGIGLFWQRDGLLLLSLLTMRISMADVEVLFSDLCVNLNSVLEHGSES